MIEPVGGEPALPACSNCGGDLTAYRTPDMPEMLWACGSCGATFSMDAAGFLRPIITELFFPACPDCQADMLAVPAAAGDGTYWRCPKCHFELTI